MLVDSDGSRYYLGSGIYGTSNTYSTNDGSHIKFIGSAMNGGTLVFSDGTSVYMPVVNNRILPTQILDPNGNYIQIAYKDSTLGYSPLAIDYITDTLGRVIQFNYNASFQLTSITAPGYGGTASSPLTQTLVQFDYQSVTASGTFSGLAVERSAGTFSTLKHIYFPGTGTGYMPSFTAYGTLSGLSARRQMTISGSTITDGVQSNNVAFNYPTTGPLTDAPGFTQRTESAANAPTATYSYASSTDAVAQTMTFTVTRPDSSTQNLTRSTNSSLVAKGLTVQREIKASGGASTSKSVYSYANDPGGEPQIANVISYDDATPTANQTKIDFDYDGSGDITNKREYGYQVSGSWVVRKRTHNAYTTITNAGVRLSETDVYDAGLDTNDANDVLMAKTTYTYDNYAAMGGMETYPGQPNSPGHLSWYDGTYTTRGNLTGTTRWYDIANNLSYTKLQKIDLYGNTVQEQLSCCNQQTMTATQGNYWSVAEQITKGVSGGPQTNRSLQYDFNTSAINSNKDDDNNLTTTVTSYDANVRPALVTLPTTETATASYNDGSLSASQSLTYHDDGTLKTVTATSVTDGWGQVINEVNVNGGNVHTWYDAMGRVQYVSNPYATGDPVYETSYVYDGLGRTTQMVLPDFQAVTTSYNGNTVTATDQVNRKTQRVGDGLGRLVTVNEQDASGNLTQATSYSYDVLGNLTQVNQGGQIRQYKYDALSRLIYEKIPEQTATIDDGTGTLWTSKYTYTDFDAIATHQDARGVITTFSYDPLNRLQQISHNTVSGVTTAPTITYTYDSDATYGATAVGKVVRINVGTDYQERYTFDADLRAASAIRTISSRTYTTSYNSYNDNDQVTQMTYPSGQVLYFRHDNSSRLSGLTNFPSGSSGTSYLSNITYNVAGQMTGDTLGNGVTEQFGFDAQRMQMTSQKAGTASPYTNRMNLTYSYGATSGQMGVGSTAGNSGQLMSASGTINGVTESAGYTYDNYGRLVTSSQTSNGSSAQRRFAYDRWDNRTGVWDAASGGTQIQSIALVNSGGIPSNRISSVTTTGTVNYTYDAAGNVTNDGSHSYNYDSENRLVSVDGGSTASYAYDHLNRRYKKTVGSTVTHYIWQGGQMLAEHNGSTGASLVDYLQSGNRMIAKKVGGGLSYLLNDHLSVRMTLDTSGNIVGQQGHLPYGEDFAESSIQEKHHFTTYERDSESGADYAVNRYDSTWVGRFSSVDHAASAMQELPQSWNRYSYTSGDPVNRTDPTGLFEAGEDPDDPCWSPINSFLEGDPGSTDPFPELPCDGFWIPPQRPVQHLPCRLAPFTSGTPFTNFNVKYNDHHATSGNVRTLGGGVSEGYEDPAHTIKNKWWFFYFEVRAFLPYDDPTPSDWTPHQSVVQIGSQTLLTGGKLVTVPIFHSDGHDDPKTGATSKSHWHFFYWVDLPDWPQNGTYTYPNGTKISGPVQKANITWIFQLTLQGPYMSCRGSLTLHLKVEKPDDPGDWTAIVGP